MSWTLTTSGAAIAKAGSNANSTIVASGATLQKFSDQVEGRIVSQTRRDWVDDYSNVDAGVQAILDDTASSMIAMEIICYDMGAYSSRIAETMLDKLNNDIVQNMKALSDMKANTIIDV